MTIGVTGFRGRLGSWLIKQGCIPIDCEIFRPSSIQKALEEFEPDVLINCAAYTKVDDAEDDENLDKLIETNLWGPARLRQNFRGLLIQISTGHVFDGNSSIKYLEDDLPSPVNRYGMSKLGGEAGAQMREPTLVVRVNDLYGTGPRSDFVRYTRDILEMRQETHFSTRLYGTPTYIPHLSEALLEVANRGLTGLLHLVSDTKMLNRYQWAKMIAAEFGLDPELIKPTSKISGKAPRPTRAGLSVEKAKQLGLPLYSPLEGLAALKLWEHKRAESESIPN
jgi:dTDP-4-dehydrorhamnose reductase